MNDGTWTYTWQHGRQLTSMCGTDVDGGANDVTIDVTYNADGLRTGKTVTTHVYTPHVHSYTSTVVAPSCTVRGYTLYECACGYSYRSNYTPALGHDYTNDFGYFSDTCKRCGLANGGITKPVQPIVPPIGETTSAVETTAVSDNGRTLESTIVEEHAYVYTGGSLMQEVITTRTTVDGETTTTTETLNFSYDASGTPMTVTYGGATYYYATNLQGDVIAILNTSGTAVVEYTYDAWGNLLTTSGSMASTLGTKNPLRYRGYVYDTETGFYYLQSRYYDPEMGRFINADGLASSGQGFLGNNMFVYCNNNPVNLVDYTGLLPGRPTTVYINDGASGYRDVTDEIVLQLTKAASHARTMRLAYENDQVDLISIYKEFYNLVNHEAPWDIKRQQPWESTIKTTYPGDHKTEVTFCGIIMTPEQLGNFTYGYLGYAYGIPYEVLVAGSYYAADFPIYWDDLSNELNDWKYIRMGYQYAENRYLEGVDA